MSRSIHPAQGESLPYNHHLHQFLTFFKHEREGSPTLRLSTANVL